MSNQSNPRLTSADIETEFNPVPPGYAYIDSTPVGRFWNWLGANGYGSSTHYLRIGFVDGTVDGAHNTPLNVAALLREREPVLFIDMMAYADVTPETALTARPVASLVFAGVDPVTPLPRPDFGKAWARHNERLNAFVAGLMGVGE